MSTVAITDLAPGVAAASADVNATMTSWNNGTAAGQISASNVRMEGIDRRAMSGAAHVVWTGETGTNTIVQRIVASGWVNNTSGAPIVITFGDGTAETNDVTIVANHEVIVHATLYVRGDAPGASAPTVSLYIERSTAGTGGPWTTVTGTTRVFSYKDVLAVAPRLVAAVNFPRINKSMTWAVDDSPSAGVATRWRIAFETTGADCNFLTGGIWTEIIGA